MVFKYHSPLKPLPPCTYRHPPADVKPCEYLAAGWAPLTSAAMSSVHTLVARLKECRSSREPVNEGKWVEQVNRLVSVPLQIIVASLRMADPGCRQSCES